MLLAILLSLSNTREFSFVSEDIDIHIDAVEQGGVFIVSARVVVFGGCLYGYNNRRVISSWKDIVLQEAQNVLMCPCRGREDLLIEIRHLQYGNV